MRAAARSVALDAERTPAQGGIGDVAGLGIDRISCRSPGVVSKNASGVVVLPVKAGRYEITSLFESVHGGHHGPECSHRYAGHCSQYRAVRLEVALPD